MNIYWGNFFNKIFVFHQILTFLFIFIFLRKKREKYSYQMTKNIFSIFFVQSSSSASSTTSKFFPIGLGKYDSYHKNKITHMATKSLEVNYPLLKYFINSFSKPKDLFLLNNLIIKPFIRKVFMP